MDTSSKVVKVIETRNGDELTYHTMEGLFIGGFKAGERVKRDSYVSSAKPNKPVPTGVVRSLTPAQMRREKELEARKLSDPKERLKKLKKEVA